MVDDNVFQLRRIADEIAQGLGPVLLDAGRVRAAATELEETREAIKRCPVGPCPVLAHFGLKELV